MNLQILWRQMWVFQLYFCMKQIGRPLTFAADLSRGNSCCLWYWFLFNILHVSIALWKNYTSNVHLKDAGWHSRYLRDQRSTLPIHLPANWCERLNLVDLTAFLLNHLKSKCQYFIQNVTSQTPVSVWQTSAALEHLSSGLTHSCHLELIGK